MCVIVRLPLTSLQEADDSSGEQVLALQLQIRDMQPATPRLESALSSVSPTSATVTELQVELRRLRSQNAEVGKQLSPSGMSSNLAEGARISGGSIVERVASSSLGLELEFSTNIAPKSDGDASSTVGRMPLSAHNSASTHSSEVLLSFASHLTVIVTARLILQMHYILSRSPSLSLPPPPPEQAVSAAPVPDSVGATCMGAAEAPQPAPRPATARADPTNLRRTNSSSVSLSLSPPSLPPSLSL